MSPGRQQKSCYVQSLDQQFGPSISRSLFQPLSQPPEELEGPCPASIATSSHALGSSATAAPDTSLAEGAAALLAMASAADKSDFVQVRCQHSQTLAGGCQKMPMPCHAMQCHAMQ